MIDFERFEALTFDCYGTLVDWERGILGALLDVLAAHGVVGFTEDVGGEALLERFGRLESAVQAGPYRGYRDVLVEVLLGLGRELSFTPTPAELSAFSSSVGSWPVFSDTVDALRTLASRYRLAIVSNVDDDLFEGSARLLGVDFDEVVTAEQVRSYKPACPHFDEALRRLDLPRDGVLHVAQSLFHDVAPARALGFTCVWVNRRAGRLGGGATVPSDAAPDLEVPDLRSLVALMQLTA